MKETILVVAAHPDDEVLGAGGTIAWHADRGDRVTVLLCGEGVTARYDARGQAPAGRLESLRKQARAACAILGAADVRFLSFPDNRFDALPFLDVVKPIERVKAEVDPTIVYTHHAGDLNRDHRIVHEAVLTAFRPKPGARLRALYAFEVASSTEWAGPSAARAFLPGRYVEIAATLDRKVRAMRAYRSEIQAAPHPRSPRSIRAKALSRGAEAGVAAAEAFEVIRQVVKDEKAK
jgi:N-acetylglucosamine malate deacetylase 1